MRCIEAGAERSNVKSWIQSLIAILSSAVSCRLFSKLCLRFSGSSSSFDSYCVAPLLYNVHVYDWILLNARIAYIQFKMQYKAHLFPILTRSKQKCWWNMHFLTLCFHFFFYSRLDFSSETMKRLRSNQFIKSIANMCSLQRLTLLIYYIAYEVNNRAPSLVFHIFCLRLFYQ